MSFASQISRCPRPYEADRGDEIRQLFEGEAPEVLELLVGTGGCSPYLKSLMERDADWLRASLAAGIEPALRG
ncbi:MAG: hypothetical protein KUG69_06410, partial [Marinosulfonomonas sp.]|nr:hypothetical protein [Marinosulfonomonas sp.]